MPGTYFGPFNTQFETQANGGNINLGLRPLGHRLILPDGRIYRYALNDATVEVAGNLYQSVAPVADHTNVTADAARAINAVIISGTLGATSALADIYAEGTVHGNDAAAEGYMYRIRRANTAGAAHALAAASAVLTVNLVAGERVQVALTTSSEITFKRHRFHQILIQDGPPTAGLAGVSPGVAAADRFYWSQVAGEAAVLAQQTLLAGLPVQAGITVSGSVENAKRRVRSGSTAVTGITDSGALLEDQDGAEVNVRVIGNTIDTTYDISGPILINAPLVGMCLVANASSEYGLIDLTYLGT